jgi:heme-degrading monooxygenase HmoA
MMILLCKTQFTGNAPLSEWEERRERMMTIVSRMPGYIIHKRYYAPDGDAVTIYKFDSEEALDAWRNHPEHVETQQRAREAFYQCLYILVSRVITESSVEPQEAPSPVIMLLWKERSTAGGESLEYEATVDRMRAIVSETPGYISCKTYSAEDGETVTVMRLESAEALKAWPNRPENLGAKSPYQACEMQVCRVIREYSFTREDGSEPKLGPWWYTPSGVTHVIPAANYKIQYKVRRY